MKVGELPDFSQMKKRRRKPGLAAVQELQSGGPNNSS